MTLFFEVMIILVIISGIAWLFGVDWEWLLSCCIVAGTAFIVFTVTVATAAWMIRNWFPICGG